MEWVAAGLRREERGLGKRWGMWESIVVIGIMEDGRVWNDRGGFPADRADGGPRKLPYFIVSYVT